MKNHRFLMIPFILGYLSCSIAFAQGPKKSDVLDFEADVIEGQKKAPDLFLQLDMETSDLSAVLYDRKNFNDYHVIDSRRRPRLSNPKLTK